MEKLEGRLELARTHAAKGNVDLALGYLREAKGYASEISTEVPTETVTEIEETAYRIGIEIKLESARHYLRQERMGVEVKDFASIALREAERYATKLCLDITSEVQQIEAQLYK